MADGGRDVELVDVYRGHRFTNIRVEYGAPVPGAPKYSRNLYDISQAPAWLAWDRRELQEALEGRVGIPDLMGVLVGDRYGIWFSAQEKYSLTNALSGSSFAQISEYGE